MSDALESQYERKHAREQWTWRLAIAAVALVVLTIVHRDPHCAGVDSLRPGQSVSITCPERVP